MTKLFLLAAVWVSTLCGIVRAQAPPTNVRVYPSAVTQTEPGISVSPLDERTMFLSAVTISTTGPSSGFKSEGIYLTTDGGQTWRGSDSCRGQLLSNHGGDPGPMIYSDGRLVLTHIGSVFAGVYSHYSTDFGQTWSNAYTISSDQPEDRGGGTSADNNPTSPYYGRMYVAWVRLLPPYPLSFSYSSNGGSSWSAVSPINGSPTARCSGGSVTIGKDGKLFVTWSGIGSNIEDFAGFAISTNGGTSWQYTQNIFDMNGINGTLPTKGGIRVNGLPQLAIDNSGGPRNGWLYIVSTEKNISPAGTDPDILLHRSSDGGQTWSAGIRVNQDPLNNGKIQYFPSIDVDKYGGVNVLFNDDRRTSSDSAQVFLAQSSDGGITWTERIISDHSFRPKAIAGGTANYQGDHIALKAVGPNLFAYWMDDYSGLYQIWQAIIPLNPDGVDETKQFPQRLSLAQNFPNPFNPSTSISFAVPGSSNRTTLTVHDILGREVATLVDEVLAAGWHTRVFSAENLSGGVYLCRLRNGNSVSTRKMLLVK